MFETIGGQGHKESASVRKDPVRLTQNRHQVRDVLMDAVRYDRVERTVANGNGASWANEQFVIGACCVCPGYFLGVNVDAEVQSLIEQYVRKDTVATSNIQYWPCEALFFEDFTLDRPLNRKSCRG